MEIDSLIPFGLDLETEQLVDVGNVRRGNACGCICPSCKTPLVARHGDKKAWHFAHRSQKVHNETRKECEYSFAVSVRLMIRQLSSQGLKFRTPRYESSWPAYSEYSHQSEEFNYVVTSESLLELKNVQVGVEFSGVTVDVLGYIEEIPFIIYITYDGRHVPSELVSPCIDKCGIVELNVHSLQFVFKQEQSGQYKELLKKYVEDEVSGKAWIYHPREKKLREATFLRRQSWLSEQKNLYSITSTISSRSIAPIKQKLGDYSCAMCKRSWSGSSRFCKNCKTHLFTIEK